MIFGGNYKNQTYILCVDKTKPYSKGGKIQEVQRRALRFPAQQGLLAAETFEVLDVPEHLSHVLSGSAPQSSKLVAVPSFDGLNLFDLRQEKWVFSATEELEYSVKKMGQAISQ